MRQMKADVSSSVAAPRKPPQCRCGGKCLQCSALGKSNRRQPSLSTQLDNLLEGALRTSSEPLDAPTRARMENSFSFDFSRVRIHRSDQAALAAERIGARAFTVGPHIVFGTQGGLDLGSGPGQSLLVHELAHVVQQRGAAAGQPAKMGEPGDALEVEADRAAGSVARGERARVSLGAAASTAQGGWIGCMWHMWRFASLIDECRAEYEQHCGDDLLSEECQEFMDGAGFPSDAILRCVGRKNPKAMAKLLSSCSTVSLGRVLGGVSRGMGLKASLESEGASSDALAAAKPPDESQPATQDANTSVA